MVENADLTRELTIFVQVHLNNHFSFFQLKNSGMIEYLVLCLSTRNGDRALDLLERFQEVSVDYNDNLKLGLFNQNDLQLIQEDKHGAGLPVTTELDPTQIEKEVLHPDYKRNPHLAESIFLRFLPVPFIKFLYEKGKQQFLDTYKKSSFESPILIWNADLRGILEQEIKDHSKVFIQELKAYAANPTDNPLPIY